jgi:hypothetical protein
MSLAPLQRRRYADNAVSVEVNGPFASHGGDTCMVGFIMEVTTDGEGNTPPKAGVFTVDTVKS